MEVEPRPPSLLSIISPFPLLVIGLGMGIWTILAKVR